MIMFVLNHMSYYYIEDPANKKERVSVAAKLHLIALITGVIVHFAGWMQSPYYKSGAIGMGVIIIWFIFALTSFHRYCPLTFVRR